MNANNHLDLIFAPAPNSRTGFTSTRITKSRGSRATGVVRELLQNSLDAAREAGRQVVRVRFEIEEHPLQDIPGLSTYREALRESICSQTEISGGLPEQAQAVVSTMQNCLEKSECQTLYVMDNGIGLDRKRMGGLLGDGITFKGNDDMGAFGNGHMVVMSASDLRYVLYGGRVETGEETVSGQAILASHKVGNEMRGQEGVYVKGITADLKNPYLFATNGEIPKYIGKKLAWIKKKWKPGAGAVIAVPGFNYFNAERGSSLWEMVSKVAASNFFAAFASGELSVEVVQNGERQTLDKKSIRSVLEGISHKKYSKDGVLAGRVAFNAYETITSVERINVSTEIGCVNVYLRENQEGETTRVDLCRNGMWITNDPLSLRKAQFSDLKPFQAVILLDPQSGDLHRIIRKAEGPLHNELLSDSLTPEEKGFLDAAMNSIAESIRKHMPKFETESFDTSVLPIPYGFASGGSWVAMQRQISPARRRSSDNPDDEPWPPQPPRPPRPRPDSPNPNPEWSPRRFRREGTPIRFSALPIPIDLRNWQVKIRSDESCRDSELRFVLDEGVDESSAESVAEEFVALQDVKIDHQKVPDELLIKDKSGKTLGVRLGALEAGEEIKVQFAYETGTAVVGSQAPIVLKTELVRRIPEPVVSEHPSSDSE